MNIFLSAILGCPGIVNVSDPELDAELSRFPPPSFVVYWYEWGNNYFDWINDNLWQLGETDEERDLWWEYRSLVMTRLKALICLREAQDITNTNERRRACFRQLESLLDENDFIYGNIPLPFVFSMLWYK